MNKIDSFTFLFIGFGKWISSRRGHQLLLKLKPALQKSASLSSTIKRMRLVLLVIWTCGSKLHGVIDCKNTGFGPST